MKRVSFFFLLVMAGGCGGADQAPKSPAKHEETELPGSIDEAQTELSRSKADVDQASECTDLCRAFQSMRRSQAALCVLTGEDDPRCAVAKQTVSDAAKRVAKCGCPGST